MSDLHSRIDKLIGGVRIQSKLKNGIGTLGCVVFDKNTNKPLGLTNRHILKKRRGFSVIQPSGKRRSEEYVIGKILRKGGRGQSNDFAVFELDLNNRDYDRDNSIFGLNGLISSMIDPAEGMKVQKVGQRTGRTFGIIESIKSQTIIIKPNPDKFNEEISDGGDSGALWVTDEDNFKAVGLHRAGEPSKLNSSKDMAFAIPIKRVMNILNCKF